MSVCETQERFVEDGKRNATILPVCSFCLEDCDKLRSPQCNHIVSSTSTIPVQRSKELPINQFSPTNPPGEQEEARCQKPAVLPRAAPRVALVNEVKDVQEPKPAQLASEVPNQESPEVKPHKLPWALNSEAVIEEKTELQVACTEPFLNEDVPLRVSSLFSIATNKNVVGVVEFRGRIYIASRDSSKIQVYMDNHSSLPSEKLIKYDDDIQIKTGKYVPTLSNNNSFELGDLVVCSRNQCLYVSDTNSWCVWRIMIDQPNQVSRWIALKETSAYCKCQRRLVLSVMFDGRLLLVRNNPSRLECHMGDVSQSKPVVIELPEDMKEVMHAIELESGNFIVSHGWTRSPLRRLCEVTRQGKMVRSFGGSFGVAGNQLNCPCYIATEKNGRIFVADYFNNRVLVVDSTLTKSSVLLEWKTEESPVRLFYSTETSQLFVGMSGAHVDVYSTEQCFALHGEERHNLTV